MPLDQLLDQLLQDDEFRRKIRLQLETQLYTLGEQSEAAYRRGKGWKQINGGDQRMSVREAVDVQGPRGLAVITGFFAAVGAASLWLIRRR